ncbi:MAG: phosphate ABC transporter permease PstA [Alphaproteobacteria bacterium]|nr:MAG: phosphate ABC transporter permease PstA [Alphaproteobacteria bacterium]
MTDQAYPPNLVTDAVPGVRKRHGKEIRFRLLGLSAILASLGFLVFFVASIVITGYGAFVKTVVLVDVDLSQEALGLEAGYTSTDLEDVSYRTVVRGAIRGMFADVSGRSARRELTGLLGAGAEFELKDIVLKNPELVGSQQSFWMTASDDFDLFNKGGAKEETATQLTPQQKDWYRGLLRDGRVKTAFNADFLTASDSRDPELAGVWGAIKGSFFALGICLLLSFTVGVLAAIYLEEFAPKNRWTSFLEVNINNLAAVPSITYGLLGLAIFLGIFGLPRSASLVGGMVLALMTLPTIIISSRVALQAVPPSIREAALGIGASHIQAVFHHVVPLALPGMLTGTIIGMARALGETAPLLMIGMVAFIADAPSSVLDPASALPVQVYLWADSPERAFAEKTAGAILVLLAFLVLMNLAAVILRKRFEKRW